MKLNETQIKEATQWVARLTETPIFVGEKPEDLELREWYEVEVAETWLFLTGYVTDSYEYNERTYDEIVDILNWLINADREREFAGIVYCMGVVHDDFASEDAWWVEDEVELFADSKDENEYTTKEEDNMEETTRVEWFFYDAQGELEKVEIDDFPVSPDDYEGEILSIGLPTEETRTHSWDMHYVRDGSRFIITVPTKPETVEKYVNGESLVNISQPSLEDIVCSVVGDE